jgi:S-adenosylmethionine:tRNA ribosyltransferase-isomerase
MTSISPEKIAISEFNYELGEDRIAQKPVEIRETSKLLVYNNGDIIHDSFDQLGNHLPERSMLVFNDTRVIPARMFFTRKTGSVIQVFLLNPITPFGNMEQALENTSGTAMWECMVGNAKKWKANEILTTPIHEGESKTSISASLSSRDPFHVLFEWPAGLSFSEIIQDVGKMPLPPYIKREAIEKDYETYQTVYAQHSGAVAAPTAGLHFTKKIINHLLKNGHKKAELTLHVGAGTFKPVEAHLAWDHPMHEETFIVDQNLLQQLISSNKRVATGTTSLRTLESLYWCGVNLKKDQSNPFDIAQHLPYQIQESSMTVEESLETLLNWMDDNRVKKITGSSSLMIMPGYNIRSVDALITNFHMPKSTLLLLIAAFVGDSWKRIYKEAMENGYRFLSYGDSSLLFKG